MLKKHNEIPLISIVIPAYNVEQYIEKTIQSIKNQTMDNYEVIIINDGSTDKTENIIKLNINNESRFQYFKTVNSGLSEARNFGITKTIGQYIFFLDGDDYIKPTFVEKISNVVHKSGDVETVIFDYESRTLEGKYFYKNYGHDTDLYKRTHEIGLKDILEGIRDRKLPITAWSYITKADIFRGKNVTFMKGVKFEDNDTTPLVFLNNSKIRSAGIDPLYVQVERNESITKTLETKDWYDGYIVRENLFKRLDNYPVYKDIILEILLKQTVYDATTTFLNNTIANRCLYQQSRKFNIIVNNQKWTFKLRQIVAQHYLLLVLYKFFNNLLK